jgi:hypothetical protein
MTRVLELSYTKAKEYFLEEYSYYNFDLPKYFVFDDLLKKVSKKMGRQNIKNFYHATNPHPSEIEGVNYLFLINKDGKYAWRPFQLIHPAIYVSLVNTITAKSNWEILVNRFNEFQANKRIRCYSIPLKSGNIQTNRATQVNKWWLDIEQQSLELALKYEYVLHTDISDCYGSIYTHSVPWAIHNKTYAKINKKNGSLLGNQIDKHLSDMSNGQTNGIPQGSVLMDFIAEIVLGYVDLELHNKIEDFEIEDFEIIRYRDDYRIFSNNPQIAEHITKLLSEILIDLGMRLNAQKTIASSDVIVNSIKSDKWYWMTTKKDAKGIQEHLLLIHQLSEEFPNSGSLTKSLSKFYNRIKDIKQTNQNITVLISILVDIMYKNPRTYTIASAILSKLLSLIPNNNYKKELLNNILEKFLKIPNTGHLKIWIQRITIKIDKFIRYDENLCKKVLDPTLRIWNSDWLESGLKSIIDNTPIIDNGIIASIDKVISNEEVDLFKRDYDYFEENVS